MLTGGGQHLNGYVFDRHGVAGLDDQVLNLVMLEQLYVVGIVFFDDLAVLHIGAVIDKGGDFHAVGQLRRAAHMIAMIVGDEDIVEPLEFGQLGGFCNAVGIATIESAPASIDEERLTRRTDDERGLAAFDVDEKDLQHLGGVEGRGKAQRDQENSEAKQLGVHFWNRITDG